MDIKQVIKNTLLTSNAPLSIKENLPPQYKDRQKEWYADETLWFTDEYAKYSSDYVEAQIQGLIPDKPFEYVPCHIRLSDIVTSSSASTQIIDDNKNILVAEKEYTYLRKGAKVIAMGSTWLVTNPANLSGGKGKGLIQRCDAVWHYLDYYGNVRSEPMCVNKDILRATDPDAQRSTMITKGYFIGKMQYNDVTKRMLDNNARMILGSGAYHLTGFMDFIQEFTSGDDSVNLLEFYMRWEEPDDAIDDMVNKVAGGKTFKWEIAISGANTIMSGGTTQLTAESVRTNEGTSEAVIDTEAYPVNYEWSTSDSDVCTVNSDGVVAGVGEGTAVVTATLVQNPNITAQYSIIVEGSAAEPHIEFNSTIPKCINAYETLIVAATYYENGQDTNIPLTWELSGADPNTYSYVAEKVYETESGVYATDPGNHLYMVSAAKNGIVISCWGGSVEKLVIKASYGGVSARTELQLVGL